jgi:hypothetical protein
MKRIAALFLLTTGSALAQSGVSIEAIAAKSNDMITAERSARASKQGSPKHAYVDETDVVFPHIAIGGGWETVMVLVNISLKPVDFNLRFYNDAGQPLSVTFRSYPEGTLTTTAAAHGILSPGSSFNFSLFDTGQPLATGWVRLEYNSSTADARLGGYAAFRLKAGGVINEGLVPLSSNEDEAFFMPFDNFEGFATGVALVNPGSSMSSDVSVVAYDTRGNKLATDTLVLRPGQHYSYVLT